jgi:hypothetical protein
VHSCTYYPRGDVHCTATRGQKRCTREVLELPDFLIFHPRVSSKAGAKSVSAARLAATERRRRCSNCSASQRWLMRVSWCKPSFSHAPKVVVPKCCPGGASGGASGRASYLCLNIPVRFHCTQPPQNNPPIGGLPAERSPRLGVLLGVKTRDEVFCDHRPSVDGAVLWQRPDT